MAARFKTFLAGRSAAVTIVAKAQSIAAANGMDMGIIVSTRAEARMELYEM
jgi:hypothetical protein